MLTWLLSFSERPRFVELPRARGGGGGCLPRLASPHTRPLSISECGAGKRVRPISNEQTDTPCYFIDIIGSAEALPILCVSDFCERERERERDDCDVIDITLKSRVIMHMITSTARRPNARVDAFS